MAGRRGAFLFSILAAALAASPALADHIHGIVTSLDGQMLTIKNDNAKSVIVQLDPNARIIDNGRVALTACPPVLRAGRRHWRANRQWHPIGGDAA